MSTPLPYSFTNKNNKYIFRTDNSVAYSIEFTDGVHYFLNLPPHIPVFEFNIKVLNIDFSVQDIQILASLIVHVENPDKDLLVSLFFDIYK